VNQAIGRSIRSQEDFANIIVVDEQFLEDKNSKYFSKWIKDSKKVFVNKNNYYKTLENSKLFLENHNNKFKKIKYEF